MAPRYNKKKIAIIALIAALCVCALGAYVWFTSDPPLRDPRAVAGQLSTKSAEEMQAEIDRSVEEGMFAISIASFVPFESGTAQGELRIENVPGNRYLMKVDIVRDDTGESVYATDLIEPGYCIQADTLDVDLDPGTYVCTATFKACDATTEKQIGSAGAKITIAIEG